MNLSDLNHTIGADITPSNTGDLGTVSATQRGQQRVLRRLLTNPGDYIFHTDYGAGLPAFIGTTTDVAKIRALIRGQIMLEDAVSRTPDPLINVVPVANAAGGGISVTISYADAATGQPVTLSFTVNK